MAAAPIRLGSNDLTTSSATSDAGDSASQRLSSTPPTSAADTASVSSSCPKLESSANASDDSVLRSAGIASSARPRRSRLSNVDTYNLKVLSGTTRQSRGSSKSKHGRGEISTRAASGTALVDNKMDTLMVQSPGTADTQTARPTDDTLVEGCAEEHFDKEERNAAEHTKDPARRTLKSGDLMANSERRISTRSSGAVMGDDASSSSSLKKCGRGTVVSAVARSTRELARLADTAEFAKVEDESILMTVWSRGKYVPMGELGPPQKKPRVDPAADVSIPAESLLSPEKKKPVSQQKKRWLEKGLYAGQEAKFDWYSGKSEGQKKRVDDLPKYKATGFMPLPMWQGQRLLQTGRDFKMPFDVCNPLPPGQPKPDEWRRMPRNRFVGEAAAAWKKSTLFDEFSSRCICKPSTGCDDDCQNRIMLYECDSKNCAFRDDHCSNRAFAGLQERRSQGGKYRIGVEVIKTTDRGYGVRSNRSFEPNQIITEYTGEIITEEECDRRMNEEYKDNDCYYLMSFDQNTILDATEKGSIARFVNHSCEPNCRMVKWVVSGKPRMALFVGEKPILTGDELTYDYNFDPFSAKNVQECRCGSQNCRGILGPRPKDKQKPLAMIVEGLKSAANAGKRKLKEFLGTEQEETMVDVKKRKIAKPTPIQKAIKTTAEAVRHILQTQAKQNKSVILRKTQKISIQKSAVAHGNGPASLASRNSSLTHVVDDSEEEVEELAIETASKVTNQKIIKNKKQLSSVKRGTTKKSLRPKSPIVLSKNR